PQQAAKRIDGDRGSFVVSVLKTLHPGHLASGGQDPFEGGLDLDRHEPRMQSRVDQPATHYPETILRRAAPHAPHLVVLVEAPDRADTVCDVGTDHLPDAFLHVLEAGGQNDQVARHHIAVVHAQAVADEALAVAGLDHADLALRDELGAADVDVVAA